MSAQNSPWRFATLLIFLAPWIAATADGDVDDARIDEIVVTADLRGRALDEVPASITLLNTADIEALATQHFEELIGRIPNLNWSGDGHRARYLQIRGVGELEQYQGAPNPSVGFLIDDIDFSGIGTIATLFDIERVEVLRGPQGSRYGANALAGLVYMQSASPTAAPTGRISLSAGSDDARSIGLAVGGGLNADDSVRGRLSAHHHRSNGFRDNAYLNRDDTNGRDETTLRARLDIDASEQLALRIAAMYGRIDDGYDAFALDNSYTMLSDKPGRDAQESLGVSLRADWETADDITLTSITAFADSDIDFSFDADWGNDNSWQPFTYDYVSISERGRQTLSQELRATGGSEARNWVLGVYGLRLDDELLTINQGDYFDPFFNFADSLDDRFESDYQATSIAAFGQHEWTLNEATEFSVGLRIERRDADYTDSSGLNAGPTETMAGGELSLRHRYSDRLSGWLSLSRGYKAGGFNLGNVPPGRREFDAEALWNLEFGMRSEWLDDRLTVDASVFFSRHEDQQVRTSFQLIPGDPASFVFFTDNAARGATRGLEADVEWQPVPDWMLYLSVGWLDASFDEFRTPQVDLSGRDQAHAPNYTLAAGVEYRNPRGWYGRIDASAKDAFYFDVSHDQRSEAYALANARVGYETEAWTLELWARNLFDERYAVRGFYFGNEPPNFAPTLYTRLGDARQVGVRFDWRY